MSRPKLKENKKRISVSISLRPDILELAECTDNKSKFFETSVDTAKALKEVINDLRAKKISMENALEELEDVFDVWESQFDDSEAFS